MYDDLTMMINLHSYLQMEPMMVGGIGAEIGDVMEAGWEPGMNPMMGSAMELG